MREIKIDFDNPGLPQRLDVVENDAQSRFFKAVLYKDGKAYVAPSGATYSIMYRGFGPQNEGWYDTINDGAGKRAACSVSGNVVTCEIARQALRVPGHVSVVLCVTGSNGYMLHGWPIDCNCRNDNYTSGTSVESFFYITQVTNADWTSAIQTWEELKNMIDPTLSLSGKAADAKATGEIKAAVSNGNYIYIDTTYIPRANAIRIPQFIGKYNGPFPNRQDTNIRASTISFKVSNACTIIANKGYEFYVDTITGTSLVGSGWATYMTIEADTLYDVTFRKTDNSIIAASDLYSAFSVYPPVITKYGKYQSGGYTYSDFNKPITPNFSEYASKLRTHFIFETDFPYKISCDKYDYTIITKNGGGNNNLNSANLFTAGSEHNIYAHSIISISSNADATDDETWSNSLNITPIDGFLFQAGGTSTSGVGNPVTINTSAEALPIRITTGIVETDSAYQIHMVNGYKLGVDYVDNNNNLIESHFWLTDYVIKPGRFALTLKTDQNSNISCLSVSAFTTIKKLNTINSDANVLYIGDSITENNYSCECNWSRITEAQLGLAKYTNVAMGGTGIIAGGANGWLNRLPNFPSEAFDLILIMGNMNDYSNNIFDDSNLGTFNDTGTTTEYGALKTFISQLTAKYPSSKIAWIVSTPRQYYKGDNDNPNTVTNDGYLYGVNSPFHKAAKAIEEVCANYSIPVLNLFDRSNFKCWDKSTKDQYFYNDGNMVHPNFEGHLLMSKAIVPFVESIL